MPLDVQAILSDVNAQFVAAASVMCDWQTIGTGAYLTVLDAALITDPEGQITDSSRKIIRRDNRMGTLLGVRMKYAHSGTVLTNPVTKVFGRTAGGAGTAQWQLLLSRLRSETCTILTSASDINISGTKFTTPDTDAHYFDTQGCNEFLIGVEVKLTVTGTASDAALQVKII